MNTFVIFLSLFIANIVASRDSEEGEGSNMMVYFGVSMVLEWEFGFLASFISMWYSRHREVHAGAGEAQLVGKQKMIAALERLKMGQESHLEGSMMAFGITGKRSLSELMMTHPPLKTYRSTAQYVISSIQPSGWFCLS